MKKNSFIICFVLFIVQYNVVNAQIKSDDVLTKIVKNHQITNPLDVEYFGYKVYCLTVSKGKKNTAGIYTAGTFYQPTIISLNKDSYWLIKSKEATYEKKDSNEKFIIDRCTIETYKYDDPQSPIEIQKDMKLIVNNGKTMLLQLKKE